MLGFSHLTDKGCHDNVVSPVQCPPSPISHHFLCRNLFILKVKGTNGYIISVESTDEKIFRSTKLFRKILPRIQSFEILMICFKNTVHGIKEIYHVIFVHVGSNIGYHTPVKRVKLNVPYVKIIYGDFTKIMIISMKPTNVLLNLIEIYCN